VQTTIGRKLSTPYQLGAFRMPPSLRCTSSLPSTCAKQLYRAGQTTRSFSTTPRQEQRITRNRRQLFRWLGSQGQNFLNPLNGSTNYLGAYNAQGQLKRVVEAATDAERKKKSEEGKTDGPAKSSVSETEDSEEDKNFKGELPPETARDLTPFPLNKSFVSQPVLSDDLREEIWKRVMKDGKSVRVVSAELGVEMSRVGAVVRLKEIEKEWEQTVSSTNSFFPPHSYDDLLKNRLVFKTITWLQNLRMRASLKVPLSH
jgi:Eukaryotic mitochondrial regulator protein